MLREELAVHLAALRPCSQQWVKQVDRWLTVTRGELWRKAHGATLSQPEGVSHQALVLGSEALVTNGFLLLLVRHLLLLARHLLLIASCSRFFPPDFGPCGLTARIHVLRCG